MYELLEDPLETPQEVPQPSLGRDIAKGITRAGSRVAETAIGLPGNLLSAGLGGLNYLGRQIGDPNPIPTYEEIQNKLPVSLPTSEQAREFTKEQFGGALEPQSEYENKFHNALETFTSLATPLGPLGKGMKVASAVKGALGGELFKEISSFLGGSDLAQGIAKGAGILTGSLGFRGSEFKSLYKKNYDNFGQAIEGKKVPSKELFSDVEKLYDEYVAAGDSPAKTFARDRLKAIEDTIQGDSIDAGKLWKLKKDANDFFGDASKSERQVLKKIIDVEKNALRKLGPDYKTLEQADDIYSSFMQTSDAMKTIKKVIPYAESIVPFLKPLLGIGGSLLGKLPHIAGGYGIYKVGKEANMAFKFFNTPTGKEFYSNVLKSAALGETAALVKDIKKLNSAAKRFEHEENKPTYELLED